MARINRILGSTESLQKASDAYKSLLELDPIDYGIYRQQAELEQQRGDYAAAADYLRDFLEQEPDSGDAHLQLAGVYQALGDLEAAQDSLEDASILSDSPLESEIGLARLEARRGFFGEAEERLAGQLNDDLGPQQRVQVMAAQSEVAFVRGQIERVIALQGEIGEIAKEFMPPIARLMGIENQQATMLALLGKTDEAIAIADAISVQLQPPMDAYMNFTYASIYDAANDRESYRDMVDKSMQVQDQLPPLTQPFLEMQLARVAIWDGQIDAAIVHLERASELLGQSFIQVFQNNLSTSSLHVMLAELYLDAQAIDESRERVDEILKVFPASGEAILLSAKIHAAEGNDAGVREALTAASEIWSAADADYIRSAESRSLMSRL